MIVLLVFMPCIADTDDQMKGTAVINYLLNVK